MPKHPDSDSLELFEILFRQNYPKLYQIAYSITRDQELSKDVVQQAFLQAFRKRSQLKDKGKFSVWITAITINEAKNLLKSLSRLRVITINDVTEELQTGSFEHSYLLKDQVEGVLTALSPDDSEILTLRYYLDLSLEDIALILNLTLSNIKIRLHRARANFKEILSLQDSDAQQRGKSL